MFGRFGVCEGQEKRDEITPLFVACQRVNQWDDDVWRRILGRFGVCEGQERREK